MIIDYRHFVITLFTGSPFNLLVNQTASTELTTALYRRYVLWTPRSLWQTGPAPAGPAGVPSDRLHSGHWCTQCEARIARCAGRRGTAPSSLSEADSRQLLTLSSGPQSRSPVVRRTVRPLACCDAPEPGCLGRLPGDPLFNSPVTPFSFSDGLTSIESDIFPMASQPV